MPSDNSKAFSDPNSESSHRTYEHGKYYNGNHASTPEALMKEGSMGIEYDQGNIRCSGIPSCTDYEIGDKNSEKRIKKERQGSASHLGT